MPGRAGEGIGGRVVGKVLLMEGISQRGLLGLGHDDPLPPRGTDRHRRPIVVATVGQHRGDPAAGGGVHPCQHRQQLAVVISVGNDGDRRQQPRRACAGQVDPGDRRLGVVPGHHPVPPLDQPRLRIGQVEPRGAVRGGDLVERGAHPHPQPLRLSQLGRQPGRSRRPVRAVLGLQIGDRRLDPLQQLGQRGGVQGPIFGGIAPDLGPVDRLDRPTFTQAAGRRRATVRSKRTWGRAGSCCGRWPMSMPGG